jgi:hypothetical protein
MSKGRTFLSRVLLPNNGVLLFGQQAELGNGFEEYGGLLLSAGPAFDSFRDLGKHANAGSWIGMASSYDGSNRAALQYFGYVWTRLVLLKQLRWAGAAAAAAAAAPAVLVWNYGASDSSSNSRQVAVCVCICTIATTATVAAKLQHVL